VRVAARVLLILASLLIAVAAAADAPAPTIAITTPEPGITIAADSVSIEATYSAPEESAILQVDLFIDEVVVETRLIDPPQASGSISFIWGASHYLDGTHRVQVSATDSEGRVGSAEIRVLLGRSQPSPPVRISTPLTGGTVSGLASVDVDPGQRGLVKYVIFLVDDVFKAMSNVSPFGYLWDTTRYLNGLHRLQAKVYFKSGGESLSPLVEVRVDNPGGATTLQQPKPAAVPSPEPSRPPARAADPALPAPMRTESLSSPPEAIQIADAAVATPGTAPFISPTGDLVIPASPKPIEAAPPAPVVVEPSAPAPLAATPIAPTAPEKPTAVSTIAEPAPAASVAEPAAPTQAGPQPAPIAVALLPASEAPVPPAQTVASETALPAPATTSPVGVASRPSQAGTQVAMLPPKAETKAPAPKMAPAPVVAESIYTVQPNDCLWTVAAAYHVSVAKLMELNNIAAPGVIHPGQRLRVPSTQLYCDGKPVAAEAVPIIADGRAIVPLRAVVESAGGTVTWAPADRQVDASLNRHQVTVTIGSKTAKLDGGEVAMTSPATLAGSRTLVPLRFLGEAFDLVLEYQTGLIRIATR